MILAWDSFILIHTSINLEFLLPSSQSLNTSAVVKLTFDQDVVNAFISSTIGGRQKNWLTGSVMRDKNYCACKCKNHFCHSMFIWANKKRSDDSVLINFLRRRHERWEFLNHLNWWWDITAFSEMCYLSKQSAFHRFHCKTRQLEEIRPPFWFNVTRPYVQLCICHVNNTKCPLKPSN